MGFGPLALVVAAGLVGPLLASLGRFGPPVVVGQIAAGLVIGNSGFGWIHPNDPLLSGLSDVGFALLMFIVGTHLPVRDTRLRSALPAGAAIAATVAVLAAGGGLALASLVGFHRPAVIAVLLATSSGAVALPVIQGLSEQTRPLLVLTVWIALADVGTVLALPIVLATGSLGRVLIGGVFVVASGLALYALARVATPHPAVQRVRTWSSQRGWGLDLRVSLLALFGAAWVAVHFGTSILIAGFTIGTVVALLGEPRRVAQQLIGLGEGFAIPLFFVHLGAQLDLGALVHTPSAIRLAIGLAVTAVAVHVVAAVVWRLPVGTGLLASVQVGVPAAVVSIGLASRELTQAQGAAVMASVLGTLVACAVGGVLLGNSQHLTDAAPMPGQPGGINPRDDAELQRCHQVGVGGDDADRRAVASGPLAPEATGVAEVAVLGVAGRGHRHDGGLGQLGPLAGGPVDELDLDIVRAQVPEGHDRLDGALGAELGHRARQVEVVDVHPGPAREDPGLPGAQVSGPGVVTGRRGRRPWPPSARTAARCSPAPCAPP